MLGEVVRSTITLLWVSFTHLAPTNHGALNVRTARCRFVYGLVASGARWGGGGGCMAGCFVRVERRIGAMRFRRYATLYAGAESAAWKRRSPPH